MEKYMSLINFEQTIEELEKLIKEMETGSLGLDESLKKFETSVHLYKKCTTMLGEAEKKIVILNTKLQEEQFKSDGVAL